ncbi:MAG: hypothetical protein O7E57_01655 [Gammaproteobacteria bacterium]|nr:hypothetical protein [Gammaproteobacteria bacterium]
MDPRLSAEIEADPESRVRLRALREIKHALMELPGVEPADDIWRDIDGSLAGSVNLARQRQSKPSYPWANVATAATVFFAAALGILWWNPGDGGVAGLPTAPLADLVLRSQQLESQVFYPQAGRGAAAAQYAWNSSQQALLYRIADVDSELNSDYEDRLPSALERERLWRQRVQLLESLVEVQRRQKPASRTALY